jgi:hypothetical protein
VAADLQITAPLALAFMGGASPVVGAAAFSTTWPLALGFLEGASPVGSGPPTAPSDVTGAPTGGETALFSLTDNAGGTAAFRWQVKEESGGTYADATGDANPTSAGDTSYNAAGLTPNTEYRNRARAEEGGQNSAWVEAASTFTTDNTGGGGGDIGILVPLGSMTMTGYAPTVVVETNTVISVPSGTLVITGYAPTVVGTVVDDDDGGPTHRSIEAHNRQLIQIITAILASGVLDCH